MISITERVSPKYGRHWQLRYKAWPKATVVEEVSRALIEHIQRVDARHTLISHAPEFTSYGHLREYNKALAARGSIWRIRKVHDVLLHVTEVGLVDLI